MSNGHWKRPSHFYPRSPRGERRRTTATCILASYFYPRSPRGERRRRCPGHHLEQRISIHAPREGSDGVPCCSPFRSSTISIHAPREGSDSFSLTHFFKPPRFLSTLPARGATQKPKEEKKEVTFLSTLPARGATWPSPGTGRWGCNFYPRSPRGERPKPAENTQKHVYFYPRSPRGERLFPLALHPAPLLNFYPRSPRGERRRRYHLRAHPPHFYPRSPRGERPSVQDVQQVFHAISIHAPREGSDSIWARASTWSVLFLSTLPARGATKAGEGDKGQNGISIHAPREGSDPLRPVLHPAHGISIHAPREGSDDPGARPARSRRISIHAPREGSDQGMAGGATLPRNFYPRSPRGERRLDVGNGLRQGGISIHAPREGSDFCPPAPPSAW